MKKIVALVMTAAMVIGLAACGGKSEQPAGGEAPAGNQAQSGSTSTSTSAPAAEAPAGAVTVKLAAIGPMTGEYAEYGAHVKNAQQMALDKWNAAGVTLADGTPVQFELAIYDDAAKVDEASAIAEQLVEDDAILAITNANFQSSVALVTGPVYDEAGILSITNFGSHPGLVVIGPHMVRNNINDQGEARNYVQMVYRLGYKKIAICGEESDFGVSTSEYAMAAIEDIKAAGDAEIECVANEFFAPATDDYAAVISKINQANPEVVICTGTYPQVAPFFMQAKKAGVNWAFAACGNCYDTTLCEIGGTDIDGLQLVTLYSPNTTDPVVVKFSEDYKAYCGNDANHAASLSYDAADYVCWLVQQTGSIDREVITEAAHSMEMPGVTGTILFGADNECEKVQVVDKIEGGKFVESSCKLTPYGAFLDEVKAGKVTMY